jgi:tetratricopeptide (TPR) repeat protein
MGVRFVSRFLFFAVLLSLALVFSPSSAGHQTASIPTGMTPSESAIGNLMISSSVEVNVTGATGEPIPGQVIITLSKLNGQFVDQMTVKHGSATFRVGQNEYVISIIAPRYQSVTKTVDVKDNIPVKVNVKLEELSAEDAASAAGFYALPPKVQKDVGKALQALRANKPNDALHPLESAQKNAPKNAEIAYMFGLYASQLKNEAQAQTYWEKALELNPKHLGALLALSNDLLLQDKPEQALPYLNRAVETEPSSWRAHALLGEALALEKKSDDAVKEAQRAIELGHEQAASAQLILARAQAQRGDRDQAVATLQGYLKVHPADAGAMKALDILTAPNIGGVTVELPVDELAGAGAAAAIPVAANWRPADVDDHVPSVETATSCSVNDVVQKAGNQLMDLVSDVDRFSATESLVHESINRWGMATNPEKRKFDYVVSIQLLQGRYLDVEEYRNGAGGSSADFPGGVATNGLPALVLIFHPTNAVNFEMTCEGLSRRSTGLAWQVHFKQRSDKPNLIKRYRIGADGPSFPVALKGRAWISADTYQIVRLETDLVAPVPQIRLAADHTEIEYGPVKFKDGNVNMWLPQSAEVFYDWKGQRIHRRHSFSNYLLFGVEEKQKISAPKTDDTAAGAGPANPNEKP